MGKVRVEIFHLQECTKNSDKIWYWRSTLKFSEKYYCQPYIDCYFIMNYNLILLFC
jgi:hypothetical protein